MVFEEVQTVDRTDG